MQRHKTENNERSHWKGIPVNLTGFGMSATLESSVLFASLAELNAVKRSRQMRSDT